MKPSYGRGRISCQRLFLVALLSLTASILPAVLAADNYSPLVGTGDFAGDWQVRSNNGVFEPYPGQGAVMADIAFDPDGNMYVQSIRAPFAVVKLSPGGDVLAYWGPPGQNDGQFQTTDDGQGISTFTPTAGTTWVYVLDSGNCRVQRFDQNGIFLGSFGACGTGPDLFSDFRNMRGLEVSPMTGDVYVADGCGCDVVNVASGRILQFDMFGNFRQSWNTPFKHLFSVAVDQDTDDVWTTTYYGAVTHFTSSGTLIGTFTADGSSCPNPILGLAWRRDLAVKSGIVYLASDGRIEKYDPLGSCILKWGESRGGPVAGEADAGGFLAGITLGPGGHVWLAGNQAIRVWTDTGVHVRTIYKPDNPTSDSSPNPTNLAVDVVRDTIYVTHHFEIMRYDLAGHMKGYWTWGGHDGADRCVFFSQIAVDPTTGDLHAPCAVGLVRQYSPSGAVVREYGIRCIGPCTGALGEIYFPMGIAVDSLGNVYVSSRHDMGDRVTKFDSTGTPVFYWGTRGVGPGQFNFLPGTGEIEIGPDGNLYVIDAIDDSGAPKRVQVFNSAGTFLRSWELLYDPQSPSNALAITSLTFWEDSQGTVALISAPWSPDSVRFGFRIYKVGLDGTMLGVVLSNLDGFGGAYSQDIQIGTDGNLYSDEISYSGSRLSRWVPLNTAPAADAGGPYSVDEGGSITLAGSGTDPDQDPLTFKWDLDNDGTFETEGQSPTFSAVGLDGPSTQTITLQVCDPHGACSADTAAVSILNLSPGIIGVTNNGPINEGNSATITVTATDPAGASDPLMYEFDCDNDGLYEVGSQPIGSSPCFFADNGSRQVNVRVTDGDGGFTSGSTLVTVSNVPPTVLMTPESQMNALGQQTVISFTCQDPGQDGWTASVDFGDGTVPQNIGPVACNAGPSTVSHTYAAIGSYSFSATVTDDDNGSGIDSVSVIVTGSILGSVSDQYTGTPISGVTVILLETDAVAVTDSQGNYAFTSLISGTYTVEMTLPFGFLTHDSVTKFVAIQGTTDAIVNFTVYQASWSGATVPRTIGYWKNWENHHPSSMMGTFLDQVRAASGLFEGIEAGGVRSFLTLSHTSSMERKAQAQLLASWLNVVSAELGVDVQVDVSRIAGYEQVLSGGPTMSVDQLLTQIDQLLSNGSTLSTQQLEIVKNILDSLNNGTLFV